jgi:hypothetical protein
VKRALVRFRSAVGVILLVGIVLSWAVVLLHNHHDGRYRPSCPACQQERVVSGQPTELQVGPVTLAPVFFSDSIGCGDENLAPLEPVPSQQSPRSPPSA